MRLNDRIKAFHALGDLLNKSDLSEIILKARYNNNWFTEEFTNFALSAISETMLSKVELVQWTKSYSILDSYEVKEIALILAGNIPAVGFHDILCVLILGYKAKIKLSSKDKIIIPFLLDKLLTIEPRFEPFIEYIERVQDFDAIIATGSNNSSVYFSHYFKNKPHIIRKNRKSIAIIYKHTSELEIERLGIDIFTHYGLGCRNVSKLLIEEGVNLPDIMEIWHRNKEIILHNKYKNNYDYNYTIMLLNKVDFLMNGAMLLVPEKSIHSRIATIHYEIFTSNLDLLTKLDFHQEDLQCIVSSEEISGYETIFPGYTQKPNLNDYADQIDTLDFLINLQ